MTASPSAVCGLDPRRAERTAGTRPNGVGGVTAWP